MSTARRIGALPLAIAGMLACGSPEPAAGDAAVTDPTRLLFEDDFRSLDLWNGKVGTWEPHYAHGGRNDPGAEDLEYYVDPRLGRDALAVQAQRPFEVSEKGLSIVAKAIAPAERALTLKQPYTSGFLNSRHAVTFTYGYVEVRAKIPSARGLWPAFWLLPVDGSWPPEIDMLESIGGEGDQYWATAHTGSTRHQIVQQTKVIANGLHEGFHDFGLSWTARTITWYYDGRPMSSIATPADLRRPMYLILCLAVGGKWAGAPDRAEDFPARLRIQRVRIYRPSDDR